MRHTLSLSLSLRFFYMAQQQPGSSRAMVVITALGIIQLNAPSVPRSVLFFSPVIPAVCGGGGGSRGSGISLGWVLRDPVIWLDTQASWLGAGGECEQALRESVLEDWDCPFRCIHYRQTFNHTITLRQDKLFLVLNRKRKKDGDKNK